MSDSTVSVSSLATSTRPAPPARVAIVEDDAGIREGWTGILERMSGYQCCAVFDRAETALAGLTADPPDLVLMDINLPGMSGIECTRLLKDRLPEVEIIMLTMFGDRDHLFDALRAGASGYLLKRTTPAALRQALDEVMAGGSPMSPQVARQVVQFFRGTPPAPAPAIPEDLASLSDRESEILRLLASGRVYKEIADHLSLSLDTVRTYIRRIYQKLQVHSRTEAVVKYVNAVQVRTAG